MKPVAWHVGFQSHYGGAVSLLQTIPMLAHPLQLTDRIVIVKASLNRASPRKKRKLWQDKAISAPPSVRKDIKETHLEKGHDLTDDAPISSSRKEAHSEREVVLSVSTANGSFASKRELVLKACVTTSAVIFMVGILLQQLAEKMGIKTDEMEPAYTASMAAPGHEVAVTPLIGKLRLHIQGHEEFYIMPLDGCDVVLGMPWFYNHKAVLDSFNKTVTLEIRGRKIGMDVKLKGESVPLVSASAVPRLMKQHISAYLIYVKERDETESSNLSSLDVSQRAFLDEMTPFEAMYGYNCPTPINFLNSRNKVELSREMLEKMNKELAKIRGNIREAQKRHKLYYDKKHRVVEYEIGDMVFLKVIPEKSHLILGKDRRLSPRFAGPFKILKRIGSLAYKLKLPSHVKVHPVFHVSLLKKYVPNVHHVLQDNSKLKDDGTLSVEPDLVLDRRVKHLRNRDIVELLVKWQNYPVEDASWVDLSVLQSEFLSFQL
ncbi:hypothetical protein L7F22_017592 [Adiantum nelumboides]|nr:hypothetical protein [Adiantum nelumboides]